MFEFREIVKEAFDENNIISTIAIQPRTYEELCDIFNVSLEELEEDKDDNKAYLYLAYDYYKKLLQKIDKRDYDILKSGALYIDLDDFTVFIDNGNHGSYNYSNYDGENKRIYLYTKDLDNIKDDIYFRSNFMHEVTHYLSEFENDNSMPWNYSNYSDDKISYYTQPTEILSNKVAICDFMINLIKKSIRNNISEKDLLITEFIQKQIDRIIDTITSKKGFIYHEFFNALAKDKEAFKEFYKEIVETCIEYIEDNLQECTQYAMLNDLVESLKLIK